MPLHRIIAWKKDGTKTDEIIFSKTTSLGFSPSETGIHSSSVSIHKYEIVGDMNPSLIESKGKKYIVPYWIEVHPKTTMNDILFEFPKPKDSLPKVKLESESQSGLGQYKTTFNPNNGTYKCNCMGYWRSKGNCKHVKELRVQMEKKN